MEHPVPQQTHEPSRFQGAIFDPIDVSSALWFWEEFVPSLNSTCQSIEAAHPWSVKKLRQVIAFQN